MTTTTVSQKRAMGINWKASPPPALIEGKWKMPRSWQNRVFAQLENEKDVIINAPTASGKSIAISFMLADILTKNPTERVIIAVPQTIIGDGFRSENLILPNGTKVEWIPSTYLCDLNSEKSHVESIKHFLESTPSPILVDRVVICTHASLVNSFQKHRELFKNIRIVIDEAHHILFGVTDDEEESELCNRLGSIIKYSIDNESANIPIWLTTATFFRGDKNPILPEKYIGRFKRYNLPYDEFLPDCYPLEHFSFDFLLYKGTNYKSALEKLFTEKIGKTLVYIPSVNSRYTVGDKNGDVEEVYKSIGGKRYKSHNNGIIKEIYSKVHSKWVKCLNLVDESDRDAKKDLINKSHRSDVGDDIDVIISLNMFIEGASWKWADRECIIGKRGSLNNIIQLVGRLFRSAPGKTSVSAYYILPYIANVSDEDFRDNFNDYMKAIIGSMLILNIMMPSLLSPKTEKQDRDQTNIRTNNRFDYVGEQFPDENKMMEFQKDCIDAIKNISADNAIPVKGCSKEEKQQIFDCLDAVLDDNGITENRDEIKNQIIRQFTLQSLMLDTEGLDVSNIDIDLISAGINPCAFVIGYTSNMVGAKTFKEFREATNASNEKMTTAEFIAKAMLVHPVN